MSAEVHNLLFTETGRWLFEEYGAILDSSTTAKVLGFKSTSALQQARRGSRLPIPMFQIPGRRGWYSHTKSVGAWLDEQCAPIPLDSGLGSPERH
ncbi:hypothetical protein [Dyella sp. Tek66A03]|uniref:hypothetical protein n=1 Tax=Dyella sp. Tek66A03 TaxID=3458298 RepID=UPI00403E3A0E